MSFLIFTGMTLSGEEHNLKYPHEVNPPFMQKHYNPTGSYLTEFSLPAGWERKEIFLNFGAVGSAMYVWINEQQVGYSEDSKTPAVFNITPYLREGKNARDLTSVNIDCKQLGLGGDDSWGTHTHPEYKLFESSYSYSFNMVPVHQFQTP